MIRTFLFLLLFYVTLSQAQVTKVINNNLHFVGKSQYNIVFTDSISRILGVNSIQIMKDLFFTDEYSYVSVKLRKLDLGREYNLIVKINNDYIDFKKSIGFSFRDEIYSYMGELQSSKNKGFGKLYLDELTMKNSLYTYAKNSQKSVVLGTISSISTTTLLTTISSVKSKRKNNNIPEIFTGVIGGGITLGCFISWIDSYKYVKIYSAYKEAINIEDLKLK